MYGVDLDQPIIYQNASFRYFDKGEHHVTRVSGEDVLLLMLSGTLRFFENGEEISIGAGEYYIQEKGLLQEGKRASDLPRYLYVHFLGTWCEGTHTLPRRGRFDASHLADRMAALDRASHGGGSLCEKTHLFFSLLLSLCPQKAEDPTARAIADHIEAHIAEPFSLAALCKHFHYSENYVIRIFKRAYGVTPVSYLNNLRLSRATELLEQTSRPVSEIATAVGYGDYAYFFRLFVKKTGVSPTVFRQRLRDPL